MACCERWVVAIWRGGSEPKRTHSVAKRTMRSMANTKSDRARFRLWRWVAVIVIMIATVAIVIWSIAFELYWWPIRFEASRWRATPAEHTWRSVRLRMVDDLMASGRLIGLAPSSVETLLGPPDRPRSHSPSAVWTYYLGLERNHPFAIDGEWLNVEFAGGHCTNVSIWRD